jgi:hypothetical protein
VPLFHLRHHSWREHFSLGQDGALHGLTLEERVTVQLMGALGQHGPPVGRRFIEPGFPDPRGLVFARGDDACAVGAERGAPHPSLMLVNLDEPQDSGGRGSRDVVA